MTNTLSSSTSTKPLMEQLDLDSFLNSISEDDTDNSDEAKPYIPHRTVDDILNDSDSSSAASPPRTPSFHRKPESVDGSNDGDTITLRDSYTVRPSSSTSRADYRTLNSLDKVAEPVDKNKSVLSKYNLIQRFKSDDFSAFSSRRPSSSSSSLFGGGVRVSAKPGAALAAAAAASRSTPSPYAATLKSRRASSVSLDHKMSDTDDLLGVGGLRGVGDNSSQVDFRSVDGDTQMGDFQSAFDGVKLSSDGADGASEDGDVNAKSELAGAPGDESSPEGADGEELDELQTGITHRSTSNLESVEDVPETASSHGWEDNLNVDKKSTVSSTEMHNEQHVDSHYADWDILERVDSNIFTAKHSAEKFSPENDETKEQDSRITTSEAPDGEKIGSESENKEASPDSSITNDVAKLVEDRLAQLESERASKKTEQNSLPQKKPLEVAEELEKKHASTGLHWEEGAVAQPMRLEGVRRGSTVLGYFDIDAENTVTRTISSQAFRRDYGSAQVVAVHQNYIAVGMSKGVVLVVPSKYSVYHPDNLDSKMSMLGLLEEKSPVTSLCFNQQGDLLLAGYGDGHITLWDVTRTTPVKVITGEHSTSVVHALFLGQQFRAVTGDCKGLVLLHTFSVGLLGRYTVETQCLLDGQKTGKVLCASPLLPDGSGVAGSVTSQSNFPASTSGIGGKMGGVVGGYSGWKLFSEGSSLPEEGVVIFVTYQTALVVRLTPSLEVYAQLSRPDGVREGSMPYTAWKCTTQSYGSSTENMHAESSDKISLLAIAWDRKVQVAKLVKSELKVFGKWTLDSAAIGLTWLDDQMLVILTLTGQLCLFARDGTLIHQTSYAVDGSRGDDLIAYHTQFTNIFGNPEKAYHNCVAVRGASVYIIGPMHLVVSRLLPWKERIQVLRKAGDWMGALNMAMTLYDGHAHGVIDLPRSIIAVQEAIMPYLVELLLSYVDEVFSYISVACFNQIEKVEQLDGSNSTTSSLYSEIKEQFTRVGGVAVEFCVHIKRTDILFDEIFSKFVASQHRDTFLELLEPYILKDMLGSLPPEIMQALVEHYSRKGWLQRVEQCVLHMDISSLDFNQVVRLCQEHGLYGALIYLFNKGLDDFRSPLEELLAVLRNNERDSVTSLGYRMLVYLKHCFLGLAFPPGHGTLPSERLPSLRTELLQFLLLDSGAPKSRTVSSLTLSGAYLNLYYLLELDTEATLDVLRFAFEEHQICKSENSEAAYETTDENMSHIESQNSLLQKTVDALVLILDVDISQNVRYSGNDESESHIWPSKKDVGHLIEFIASYVAAERATVSKSVLSQLLEYLTSENNILPDDTELKKDSMRKREKQVLAVLNVVPETEWNASYVLHLCESAKFYQVCGLIHSVRHQYVAALDSYMKDADEPVHAFSFIKYTLSLLSGAELAAFQSAVRSRIPELTILSRECTFVLVFDHFNKESGHILSDLHSHPQSLFLYLKTVIEVHLSGTLNFSCLRTYDTVEDLARRRVDYQRTGLQAFLNRCSDFPKFMRNYPVEVTDGMVELYLELLCKFEPDSVLKFLETFESYRVEHCLRLCQEYGIIDGAAFLLERVGDVGNALVLTLTGISDKFAMLEAAVDSIVLDRAGSNHTYECFDAALGSKEVELVRKILHACVGLCQRNTPRLDPEESESLWFLLLDSFCKPLMLSEGNCKTSTDDEKTGTVWRISKTQKGASILKRLFAQFIKEIVEGMIGYVRLPSIMSKLLADNGCQEFGDFKLTILGMLGTYGFERRILETAKSLIEDDTFYTMSMLKKGACHGYGPRSLRCCICNCPFNKTSTSSGIRVYICGHATHLLCELQENDAFSQTVPAGCPICVSKKKVQSSKNKMVEQSLVSRFPPRRRQALGASVQHPHESDAFDNSRGLHQISRFEILTNLQKDQRSIQIESIPQLRLAPPAVYHEKVSKGTYLSVGESRGSELMNADKPSKSRQVSNIKVKESSSSLRFPLKSKIFGKF